jgi:hypothetical protein
MTKMEVTRWEQMHYRSTCKLVDNRQVGDVVDKTWFIVVRERETMGVMGHVCGNGPLYLRLLLDLSQIACDHAAFRGRPIEYHTVIGPICMTASVNLCRVNLDPSSIRLKALGK